MRGLKSFIFAYFSLIKRAPVAFIMSLLVSVFFSIVMVLQIFFTFKITGVPFESLTLEQFLLASFADQFIFFVAATMGATNIERFAKRVVTGNIDLMLLRPVSILFFVFASRIRIEHAIMLFVYGILCVYEALHIGFSMSALIFLFVYLFIAAFLYIFMMLISNAIGILIRSVSNVQNVFFSFDGLLRQRPTEIFPKPLQLLFTFIVPHMFATSYVFDVIRGRNVSLLWGGLVVVTVIFGFIANRIWDHIYKTYESIG